MSFAIRNWLPNALKKPLWGNRKKWGLEVNADDSCWQEWQKTYATFYAENQRAGIGIKINDAGYRVMSSIDLTDKLVLEIGAGDIRHLQYLKGKPSEYVLADISPDMMAFAEQKLTEQSITHRSVLLQRNQPFPLADESIDVIVSFYSLEHLYPLRPYLQDMHRVLKPGGVLIGAIPAEGGLAWGGGANAHLSPLVQEEYSNRSRQNHLLGASQFRRPHPQRTRYGISATISGPLASAVDAHAGS